MANQPTLVKPPPVDRSKSAIENALELTKVPKIAPDIYTNTRPLWHYPGFRGIYGGAMMAQCLLAAQRTVPSNFTVHSMHCHFVLPGDSQIPVTYHTEHVRDGSSYATRTVQARQSANCILTTTLSFMRENMASAKTVHHAVTMPQNLTLPPVKLSKEIDLEDAESPITCQEIEIVNVDSKFPHEKRKRHWIKAKGRISSSGGHPAHLSALAYMSDSFLLGTILKIHNSNRAADGKLTIDVIPENFIEKEKELKSSRNDLGAKVTRGEVSMIASLDHSVYFHEPRHFRADEWMFTEMSSPWSGDGRGVVTQHIFAQDGTLVATCFQEGIVRLKQDQIPPKLKL